MFNTPLHFSPMTRLHFSSGGQAGEKVNGFIILFSPNSTLANVACREIQSPLTEVAAQAGGIILRITNSKCLK